MKQLRKTTILQIVRLNCLNLDTTSLSAEAAMKVLRYRRAMKSALANIQSEEMEILSECGLSVGENGKLVGDNCGIQRFAEMQGQMYGESVDFDLATISYDEWHSLQQSNKQLVDAEIEDVLEGILWEE